MSSRLSRENLHPIYFPDTTPAGHEDWSRPKSLATMGSAPEDDFNNFLDLDSIDLNFPILDGTDLTLENGGAPQPAPGDAKDFGKAPFAQQGQYAVIDEGGEPQQQQWLQREQGPPKQFPERLNMNGFDAYSQAENWMHDQNFQQHYSIPPTPNSTEMYQPQYVQQHLFQRSQRYPQYQKDDAMGSFTPNESPHFVGSEASFSMADFTDPGAFILDPLTSPALNPHHGSAHGSIYRQSHTTESSRAGSPAPLELDDGNLSSTMNDRPRKTRKRAPPPSKSAPTSAGPKPLTSTASRKRKGSVSTRSQARNGVDSAAKVHDPGLTTHNRSEVLIADFNDLISTSASPQPQYEASMAPPPKPSSVKSTPTLRPQPNSNPDGFPPATPASLMRLQQQVRSGELGNCSPTTDAENLPGAMEELILPEAAAPAASIQPSSKRSQPLRSVQVTPILNTSAPRPTTSAVASPVKDSNGISKTNQARGSRKRNSMSTTLVSPALRPRISPSIKPLLPESSHRNFSDETHALLLASKSNYQNLLEGNHLPGVNYPSELSTNLTSKRTSHKIAEQGRRNRINTALQEMQTLLPASPVVSSAVSETSPNSGDLNGSADDEGPPGSKTPTTQGANSKAATVESAIDYIKKLNSRLADKEIENERLRKEMASLKAKLEAEA